MNDSTGFPIVTLTGYTIPEPITSADGIYIDFRPDTYVDIPAIHGPGRWEATFTVVD